MGMIRRPAVAGAFYTSDPAALAREVRAMLSAARVPPGRAVPKALIVPHAGLIYSGPIAASAYARLLPARERISRVVLFGPAHRVAFRGIAVSTAEAFDTPLGRIPLDAAGAAAALKVPGVGALDAAHAEEHSLEVQLPFLQSVLARFALVPMVVGDASPDTVAAAIEALWGGPETLILISSDLSHYLDYASARAIDARTCAAIEHLDGAPIGFDQACGRLGVAGLLTVARRRALAVETVDLRNSGDTAGPRDRVVGYGAWAFTEPGAAQPENFEQSVRAAGPVLLALARDSIATFVRTRHRLTEPEGLPPVLRQPGAAFVTLKRSDQLRGCIGSPQAWRPLGTDVLDNAVRAAVEDPRFPPLTPDELDGLDVSVSVLTPPEPVACADEAALLAQLRPRIDGLIIHDGPHAALFLPAVWEQLPDKAAFLRALKRKAGLAPDHWSPTFRASRFTAIEIG